MAYLKTALLIAALAASGAGAQEAPQAESPPEKAELPIKPVVPPHWKPIKRRSVQQVIEPTARIGAAAPSYSPSPAPSPPAATPGAQPAPVRTTGCDAGGCNDVNGQRYNSGPGNTLLGPQGQLCTKGVVGIQCN
jgi:hypothetical protein